MEKKFYLPISFEAKSDKSKNTTTRLVAAQILSNAYDSVLLKYETTGEAFNIPLKKAEKKIGLDRATLAIYCTKFLDKSVDLISKLPKDKLESLYRKNGIQSKPNEVVLPAVQVQKQMSLGKPKAYVSGAYGNIIESASTTNNWLGFAGSAAYGNTFQVQGVNGDYELTGKYQYNQVISLVPRSGGAISGGTISEYRSDLDLNTIYPVADYYGYKGLLLVGLKSANMMNPIAPVSLLAVNLGVATTTVVMNRNVFGRVYYSLILNATKATSVLGTPSSILNYEAGIDFDVMKTPMLVGYSGETMFLDAGYSRFYNMVFLRYFLI